MTDAWTAAGSHAVQFYDNEQFVHHAIAEYFTQGAHPGDPLIMVSRPRTFKAVAEHLTSGRHGPAIDTDRILFIDAEAALPQIMDGETLDPARAERLFKHVLSQAWPSHAHGTVRLYGEIVDMLCQRGRHATAIQFEGLARVLLDLKPQLSILCGYATERFKDDTNAAQLRAVCQKHTHVIPAESFTDALDDRTRHQQAVMLQHSALDHVLATQRPPRMRTSGGATPVQTVYVVDDNANLRRSLGRLLTASNWPVRTFDSAEAFLAELDKLSSGCLIVDIQLQGMSGLELVHRLTDAGLSWPIIVMSGLHDKKTESEALRLGARAYLRKPFDPRALLDAIARALL
jgi:CheY-like chemotaxis protein